MNYHKLYKKGVYLHSLEDKIMEIKEFVEKQLFVRYDWANTTVLIRDIRELKAPIFVYEYCINNNIDSFGLIQKGLYEEIIF